MKIPEGWKLVPEKETHAMRSAFREAEKSALISGHDHIEAFFCGYKTMLAAAPTPPAHNPLPADERELHYLIRCAIALVARNDLSEVAGESRTVIAHKLELMLAAMPAPDDEPVAWMIEFTYGEKRRGLFERNLINEYREIDPNAVATPLYTRPDGLRKAAEEAYDCLTGLNDFWLKEDELLEKRAVEKKLRAELKKGES